MTVDASNWKILEILQTNARTPVSKIAAQVKMSSPAVSERIQKLEDAGIIEGYTARLNMVKLNYSLCVYISIKIRFGQVKAFTQFIKTVPEITECHKLTGSDCMLMRGYVRDSKHLDDLNIRLTEYGELTTSLLLDSIVDRKIIEPF